MQASGGHTRTPEFHTVLHGPPTAHGTHNCWTLRGYSMLRRLTESTNRKEGSCWQAGEGITPPKEDISVISEVSACNKQS